ncbi:MAG: pyridoxamine 5'-phosphate oxidase family protein [Actinobacteria bacterium]|nr:pyridoxamine 5'-phosphate oxidase family protein [Actinomycetota bacterium]
MTASLPDGIQEVFDRFITTEYTTIDRNGQPITWPVTPYYWPGSSTIDVTTGLGYPKKAADAAANPRVALLFSDPTGSGLASPPTVLVQGTAAVDDRDLDANRERYARESAEKLPGAQSMQPPKSIQRMMSWYYTRIYVRVRPERVYAWRPGSEEPELFDAHMEEVRSGHSEEPHADRAGSAERPPVWDARIEELGERYDSAVLSLVAPDGFPFSARVPVTVDRASRRIRVDATPPGVPIAPGRACLTAHDHAPDFTWQRNFQVRGDLARDDRGWAIVPSRVVGGFELPPGSGLQKARANLPKIVRFRRIAKREAAKRS